MKRLRKQALMKNNPLLGEAVFAARGLIKCKKYIERNQSKESNGMRKK